MRYGAEQYQRTSEAGISPKETERAAFTLVTRDLEASTLHADRVRALGRNHQLWSILVKDMSLAENRLPDDMKSELIQLGLWSMRYSILALLNDLATEPLVTVNRNVLAGLLEQASQPLVALNTVLPAHAV